MFEWCKNRLEITSRSVFVDVMLNWVTGQETLLYRHAVQQSMKLFLASAAGLLKPVKNVGTSPSRGWSLMVMDLLLHKIWHFSTFLNFCKKMPYSTKILSDRLIASIYSQVSLPLNGRIFPWKLARL